MWSRIALTMSAFAANSIFCRLALTQQMIDPYSFSLIRMLSGALVLALLLRSTQQLKPNRLHWKGGVYLTGYILAFSVAYVRLDAGLGALLLFGTVQISMALYALYIGEKMTWAKAFGLLLAFSGILILFLPVSHAPPVFYVLMMVIAGLSWAAYSVLGMSSASPVLMTYQNFLWAIPICLLLSVGHFDQVKLHGLGVVFAVISGTLTSALAYVLWYKVLKKIDSLTASTVQLSVPCLALLAGVLLLHEPFGLKMLLATMMVLSGIALLIFAAQRLKHADHSSPI